MLQTNKRCTHLYIFRRDAPRQGWKLIKTVPLPVSKAAASTSFRTPLGPDWAAEVWLIEAASEQGAWGRLAGDGGAEAERAFSL